MALNLSNSVTIDPSLFNELATEARNGFPDIVRPMPYQPFLTTTDQFITTPVTVSPPAMSDRQYTYQYTPPPVTYYDSHATISTTGLGGRQYSSYEVNYVTGLEQAKRDLEDRLLMYKVTVANLLKSVKTMKNLPDNFFGTPQAVVIYMDLLVSSALGKLQI